LSSLSRHRRRCHRPQSTSTLSSSSHFAILGRPPPPSFDCCVCAASQSAILADIERPRRH
jgi:hypothetical protein